MWKKTIETIYSTFLPWCSFTFFTCCILRCLVCFVFNCLVCIVVSCLVCIVVSCHVCIFVVVLWVLLSSYVYLATCVLLFLL